MLDYVNNGIRNIDEVYGKATLVLPWSTNSSNHMTCIFPTMLFVILLVQRSLFCWGKTCKPDVVAHSFNPKHLGGRGRRISEFEASLVYKVSSRTARATQRNAVSKKQHAHKFKTDVDARSQPSDWAMEELGVGEDELNRIVIPQEEQQYQLTWPPPAPRAPRD